MSLLNNKSEFNFEGASLLIQNTFYAPSVHCSYYSVFQKIKHLYVTHSGITYEQYDANSSGQSSHSYLIREFGNLYLRKTNDQRRKRKLIRKIQDLKTLRLESDYHNVQIGHSKSKKALEITENILKDIKTVLR